MEAMQTEIGSVRRHRWLLGTALCGAVIFCSPPVAVAERDHLLGIAVRDTNEVPAPNPVTLTGITEPQTCELRRVAFFLMPTEKNGGDDSRGGPAGRFVCYRAKCTSADPVSNYWFSMNSQFNSNHAFRAKKVSLVCLPAD